MSLKPSASHVSRVLAKAGHRKSVSSRSMVRGLPNQSQGFRLRGLTGCVQVEFETGSYVHHSNDKERTISMLSAYARTLREAGYTAEITAPYGESADLRRLVVTKRKEA